MHTNHPNWRGDLPLLCKCVGAGRTVSIKRHTRIIQRFERYCRSDRAKIRSRRIVRPFGRTARTKLQQWSNGDKTFAHLAFGINHKVNRWR
jgi:hypothetical protein